jgi:hypothetical protein
VLQDQVDHGGLFDAGDDLHRPSVSLALIAGPNMKAALPAAMLDPRHVTFLTRDTTKFAGRARSAFRRL